MANTLNTRIKNKRDTAANWETKNPVLLNGEIILVDTNAGEVRMKIGDGIKTYTQLPFIDETIKNQLSGKLNKADVDSELSITSENPIQNKAITKEINSITNKLPQVHFVNELPFIVSGEPVDLSEEISEPGAIGWQLSCSKTGSYIDMIYMTDSVPDDVKDRLYVKVEYRRRTTISWSDEIELIEDEPLKVPAPAAGGNQYHVYIYAKSNDSAYLRKCILYHEYTPYSLFGQLNNISKNDIWVVYPEDDSSEEFILVPNLRRFEKLGSDVDLSNYYTKTEVDNKFVIPIITFDGSKIVDSGQYGPIMEISNEDVETLKNNPQVLVSIYGTTSLYTKCLTTNDRLEYVHINTPVANGDIETLIFIVTNTSEGWRCEFDFLSETFPGFISLRNEINKCETHTNEKIGDLNNLTTLIKNTLVGAVNEVNTVAKDAGTLAANIGQELANYYTKTEVDHVTGDLNTLKTQEKSNIVDAINESITYCDVTFEASAIAEMTDEYVKFAVTTEQLDLIDSNFIIKFNVVPLNISLVGYKQFGSIADIGIHLVNIVMDHTGCETSMHNLRVYQDEDDNWYLMALLHPDEYTTYGLTKDRIQNGIIGDNSKLETIYKGQLVGVINEVNAKAKDAETLAINIGQEFANYYTKSTIDAKFELPKFILNSDRIISGDQYGYKVTLTIDEINSIMFHDAIAINSEMSPMVSDCIYHKINSNDDEILFTCVKPNHVVDTVDTFEIYTHNFKMIKENNTWYGFVGSGKGIICDSQKVDEKVGDVRGELQNYIRGKSSETWEFELEDGTVITKQILIQGD